MEFNETALNPFFLLLKKKFKAKYELTLANRWIICIPSDESLKNLSITEDLIDEHILKPLPELPDHYVSTDAQESRIYKFDGGVIHLMIKNEDSIILSPVPHKVQIVSTEKGSDNEECTVVFVNRLLHEKYTNTTVSHDASQLKLNNSITSYKEALDFLYEVSNICSYQLPHLKDDIDCIDLEKYDSASELGDVIQSWIKRHWVNIMNLFKLDIQSDGRFQKLLSLSLELFIMHHLHDGIYSLLSNTLEQDDFYIKDKITKLINAGVTPDQLGVSEAFAISMPSAIVELATLDARQAPFEKLFCLKSTLDLITAEVKGALADIESQIESNDLAEDNKSVKMISTDDLTSLLVYVIVKSRPSRLITDLHYIENFLWATSPLDGLDYTIVSYKNALHSLHGINPDDLPPRSSKVRNELPMSQVLNVVSTYQDQDLLDSTPLDRQVRELATMIEKCTRTSDN
ncbi:uncharacterized protein LOC123272059 [Cotesia glomerata]|uniref:VPS9 domain-containing protein n=1 Tax=Cotesia glomerata TaxID=32391 RepID=A0AAV7ITP0_COTGL|nr:uncharacterized protein LOC123272059 [Cotesia glomerata]XP_044594613.1 uncharacterized protein LOC123272059 [Cotesia glomerata]KAH0557979.1 hypothetical protein KQX54_013392 [Cotesia glomerata]